MITQFLMISGETGTVKFDAIKLSGALIYAFSVLYPDRIHVFSNEPDLRVTDIFPVADGEQFFPLPDIPMVWSNGNLRDRKERIEIRKRKKDVPAFVNFDIIKKIASRFEEEEYSAIYAQDLFDEILASQRSRKFLKEIAIPGVAIDSITLESKIYTKELVKLDPLLKQWLFIATGYDEFLSAAAYLQDSGVSARRSTGMGRIKVSGARFPTRMEFVGEGLYMILAPFIPSPADLGKIDFSKSAYSVDVFAGTSSNGSSTGIYRYFRTGSVFYLKERIDGIWIRPNEKRLVNFSASYVRISK